MGCNVVVGAPHGRDCDADRGHGPLLQELSAVTERPTGAIPMWNAPIARSYKSDQNYRVLN